MKKLMFGVAVCLVLAGAAIACKNLSDNRAALPRPEGPCDVYERGGAPCVAAHSTTRALYAAYDGPLYQVMRESDGKTLDIGVVRATADDPPRRRTPSARTRTAGSRSCMTSPARGTICTRPRAAASAAPRWAGTTMFPWPTGRP